MSSGCMLDDRVHLFVSVVDMLSPGPGFFCSHSMKTTFGLTSVRKVKKSGYTMWQQYYLSARKIGYFFLGRLLYYICKQKLQSAWVIIKMYWPTLN